MVGGRVLARGVYVSLKREEGKRGLAFDLGKKGRKGSGASEGIGKEPAGA